VVIFRSKRKEVVDKYLLHVLDQQSHIEATASGGLLKYWFGDPNPERRNVATCKRIISNAPPPLNPVPRCTRCAYLHHPMSWRSK
jgi:hypothetical protein